MTWALTIWLLVGVEWVQSPRLMLPNRHECVGMAEAINQRVPEPVKYECSRGT